MVGSADDYGEDQTRLLAKSIRGTRLTQGISQTELARRAGVDLASVFRAEKGVPVRLATIKKIAAGLDTFYEDLLIDKERDILQRCRAVHRATEAQWFPGIDKRPKIPPDVGDQCKDSAERRRLGKVGFVPWFMCPPLIVPERGPGLVLLEICSEMEGPFNHPYYEDGALYMLRGEASVTVGDDIVELSEGDWCAFRTSELARIVAKPAHDVVTALWIGANRPAKQRPGKSENTGQTKAVEL